MKTKNIWMAILVFALFVNLDAIAQKMVEDYSMVFALSLTPVRGKEKALENALKAHNAKFHTEGAYKSTVSEIVIGANTGDYVWFMGPMMFRNLDARPEIAGHEDDWSNTIDPFVESYGNSEYWKKNKKLSYSAPNDKNSKFRQVWIIEVARGKRDTFNELLGKVVAVHKKEGKESFNCYNNQFNAGDGRDVALVFGFDTWSELDEDDPFKNHYEAMYGKDSWVKFLVSWNSVVVKVKQNVQKNVE